MAGVDHLLVFRELEDQPIRREADGRSGLQRELNAGDRLIDRIRQEVYRKASIGPKNTGLNSLFDRGHTTLLVERVSVLRGYGCKHLVRALPGRATDLRFVSPDITRSYIYDGLERHR